MVKKTILCSITMALLLSSLAAGRPHSEAGSAGLAFLKLGIGARAVGMGEAFVATSDDATALYWNPAGICQLQGVHISLMHAEWFQDVRLEYAGAVLSREKDAFGLSFTFNTAGQIERRDLPTAEPLGTFSAHDMALGCSYARHLTSRWRLGGSLKALYQKIHLDDGWGWALDAGLLYQTPLRGLAAAGSLLNLGPKMALRQEKFKLPTTIKLGVAYRPDWLRFQGGDALLGADVSKPNDHRLRVHLGTELQLREMVALRAGYGVGYDEKGISAGVGLRQERWGIDYAYVPHSSDLGDTHRISLDIEL